MTNKLKIKLKDILPSKEDLVKLKFLQTNEEELVEVDEDDSEEALKELEVACDEVGFSFEEIQNLVLLMEAFKHIKEEWEVE